MSVFGAGNYIGGSGGGASVSALSPAYLGPIATRGLPSLASLGSGTATWMMSRSPGHILQEDQQNITVVIGNFTIGTNNAEASPGAGQMKVGLELPSGAITLANENAAGLAAMPAGCAVATFSMPSIIPRGTPLAVRLLQVNSNGVVFRGGTGTNCFGSTSGFIFGTGTPNDLVAGGAIADSSGAHNQCVTPLAILGTTRRPTFVLFGTSRTAGSTGDSFITDASSDFGELPRLVGQSFASVNFGIGSSTIVQFNAATLTYRQQLLTLITGGGTAHRLKALNEYGINDLAGGGLTAAQLVTARTAFTALSMFQNVPVHGTTVTPNTSSTDSFATLANQTVTTAGGKVLTFNDLQRAGIAGEAGYFDTSDCVDPMRTGKWPVSRDPLGSSGVAGFGTADGLHGAVGANCLIRDRGAGPFMAKFAA